MHALLVLIRDAFHSLCIQRSLATIIADLLRDRSLILDTRRLSRTHATPSLEL
jgi:hypothetical protein